MDANEIAEKLEEHGFLEIARDVAARHHVTLDELLGRRRFSPESIARRELMVKLYEVLHSSRLVARLLDRDASTVRLAARVHKDGYRWRGRRCERMCVLQRPPSSFPPAGPARCDDRGVGCALDPLCRTPRGNDPMTRHDSSL